MEKTIWLRKLGISLFNKEDSPLSISYRYLKRLASCDQAILFLKEISREGFSVLLYKDSASIFAFDEEKSHHYQEIIEKAKDNKQPEQIEDCFVAPLSSYRTERFGLILFKKENVEVTEKLNEAIQSFGELVYSELYGGFLTGSNKTLMEVKNVSLKYRKSDEKNVVDHISLQINEGELTLIMGKSGCGKSTLLNIMAGLLTPDSGEVIWKNRNICTMKEKEKTMFRKDELGYIFQNYNLIKELTVSENVSIASALSKNSMSVKEALSLVSMEEYEDYLPTELSGGMQQRVAIARALVKNASILLCDEPTGALDSENARIVMTILQKIAHEKKIPVVIVSHNPDYAILADHYILMKDGRIREEYYNHFACHADEVL